MSHINPPEPLTALLVEDNETDVFVIREILDRCEPNVRVRVAKDGQDALSYLREIDKDQSVPCPELVLLDLNLPEVPGIEILKELRSGSRCSHAHVIVVTSSD
jgi:CheY-like chemotaxis protein